MKDKMPKINRRRLLRRIQEMGKLGALQGGGVCRLALSDEDKAARELLVQWMLELDLDVRIDAIGNIMGTRPGKDDKDDPAPVMTGSHLDSVATGGLYDGPLGVLAGLEAVETLNENNIQTQRPLTVVNFTNEEGVRFTPDMMGSLVFAGGYPLAEALAAEAMDGSGATVGEELSRTGFAGDVPVGPGGGHVHAYLELHIEQGPALVSESVNIAAVEGVQGISWREYTIEGATNHAGTTPMSMRRDAGYAAASICHFVRRLALKMGGKQVGTVGLMELSPNLINVVANKARLTVDLRNPDEDQLKKAEAELDRFVRKLAEQENITIRGKTLARFEPVVFDPAVVDIVESSAANLGLSVRRMYSGAGHDAQMMARICPTAMIFVPSAHGVSHSIHEFSEPSHIEAGANVLLHTLLPLLNT
jgi:N-carbamoyl-L-amino-acid hydrolase